MKQALGVPWIITAVITLFIWAYIALLAAENHRLWLAAPAVIFAMVPVFIIYHEWKEHDR